MTSDAFLLRVEIFSTLCTQSAPSKTHSRRQKCEAPRAHKQRAERSLPIEYNFKKVPLTAENAFCLIRALVCRILETMCIISSADQTVDLRYWT